MVRQGEKALRAALQLPPVERAELVEQIMASFDFPADEAIDELWAAEAEDRIDAHDRGEIEAAPIEQIFNKINRNKTK